MHGVSIEFVLYLGYALFLALIALLLEVVARHAHRRASTVTTLGFTYHPDRDVWQCPQDKHLFPVFSDPVKKTVTYRAAADICNACPSKAACTDSTGGRTIERRSLESLQFGMQRFHRAVSLTLVTLASAILAVEIYRTPNTYPRAILIAFLFLFGLLGSSLLGTLFPEHRTS
ncbi:MAG: hypothetical protein JST61_12640 [Acidobacteria bacterium]|nr:hypothetical protein [Acidobacteriota bacterium]